jgi:hypothetical protein
VNYKTLICHTEPLFAHCLKQSQRRAFRPCEVSLGGMLRLSRLDRLNPSQFIPLTATQHDKLGEVVLKLQRYMFSFISVIH